MNTPTLPNKFTVEFDAFRKLRFKERLLILFGCNLAAKTRVIVHRREARVFGGTEVHLTKQVNATSQMQQQLSDN
jgi:hypothetical protein